MTYTTSPLYYGTQRAASTQHARLLRAANGNRSRTTALALPMSDGPEPGPFEMAAAPHPLLRPFGLSAVLVAIIAVDIVAITTVTSMAMRLINMTAHG